MPVVVTSTNDGLLLRLLSSRDGPRVDIPVQQDEVAHLVQRLVEQAMNVLPEADASELRVFLARV